MKHNQSDLEKIYDLLLVIPVYDFFSIFLGTNPD